jgi:DNA-binding IclR family transcriptional regulator
MANPVRISDARNYTGAGSAGGEPTSAGRRVRSAERVAAVLDLLRRSPQPLRHADVAQAIGLPKSSTSNLLDTLTDAGLVRRDERGYSLGAKLIELGAAAADRLDFRSLAKPVLHALSELGIGTSNLAVLQGHDILYVEKVNNPDHVIQIATRVGATVPAHMTALGKVLVAALVPGERECWLREHAFTAATEHTITSASEFALALQFASEHGYALDNEEQNLRTVCVAAPVHDHTGDTVAAISLTCLSIDVVDGREVQIDAVVTGARRVSELLGAQSVQTVRARASGSRIPFAG